MNIKMKLRNAIIKLRKRIASYKSRKKLNATNFSIISNNCWAGTAVYQPFGLKYNTPTVGLFIMDEDYIRFLEDLDYNLTQPLTFISPVLSKYYDKISKQGTYEISYPIAKLSDEIEIHFLHYKTEDEARQKWMRRVKRINRDKMLIKMSIRDTTVNIDKIVARFDSLKYKNKICFVPDYLNNSNNNEFIYVPELKELNVVGGDETPWTLNRIDIYKLLNSLK